MQKIRNFYSNTSLAIMDSEGCQGLKSLQDCPTSTRLEVEYELENDKNTSDHH